MVTKKIGWRFCEMCGRRNADGDLASRSSLVEIADVEDPEANGGKLSHVVRTTGQPLDRPMLSISSK